MWAVAAALAASLRAPSSASAAARTCRSANNTVQVLYSMTDTTVIDGAFLQANDLWKHAMLSWQSTVQAIELRFLFLPRIRGYYLLERGNYRREAEPKDKFSQFVKAFATGRARRGVCKQKLILEGIVAPNQENRSFSRFGTFFDQLEGEESSLLRLTHSLSLKIV